MIDHDRAGVIATLKRVRAQLEAAKEDADGTVHKSWQLIGEAIDHLRTTSSRAQDDPLETETPKLGDDLTSIQGISPALAEHLTSLGVKRYAEIAAWRADDVRHVAQALGLTREISRQNWIEQAAMLERRKTVVADNATADGAASMSEAGSAVAPAENRDIDLPDILEAIRNDEPVHEEASPPTAVERVAPEPLPSAEPVAAPLMAPPAPALAAPGADQGETARAELVTATPRPFGAHGTRIPTVTASPHVNTGVSERVKRLEEERQRLARNLEHAGGLRAPAEEAAVTFVIRESAQSRRPADGPSSPPRGTTSAHPAQRADARDAGAAPYVINSAEEAEVVVVKPQALSLPNASGESKTSSVRRFLKTLTGR